MIRTTDKTLLTFYTPLNQNTKTSSTTETAFLTATDGFSFGSQGGGTGPGNNVWDEFGRVVTLSSDGFTALVGAPDWTQTAPVWQSIGKTYLYSRPSRGWLTATETAGFSDHFGEAMALSKHGNLGVVGAPGTTINGNRSQGATYNYELPRDPVIDLQPTTITVNAGGTATFRTVASGSPTSNVH
jgi:hypothetical protein